MSKSRRTPIIDRNVRVKDNETGESWVTDIEYEPVPERILILAELLQDALDQRREEFENERPVHKSNYH
ncbi:hypothetical protein [Fodinicurvata sp. EGI_FJ10296]|uniref:hypothetical protein n=1 Tax=Fodinicurvata sp. EGI_FJ10296 TaxID=3231908 RepID=UPI003453A6EE